MNLAAATELRAAGRHEEARALLVALADAAPGDALVRYEAACVHDHLGHESLAVPHYRAALAGDLPDDLRRSAYLGLGSTCRTLGRYAEAEQVLHEGLRRYPEANEMRAFLAMVEHNLGRSKPAVEGLLRLLVETSADPGIRAYAGAIAFYAGDVDRVWPAPDE